MFSSLKYIFGYTDETGAVESSSNDDSADFSSSEQPLHNNEQSNTGTALLEQTLNAATTKLTEQLLPPQASIEQLQSSSQQLLPSITEQHEEEKLKKKKDEEISNLSNMSGNKEDNDDGDEDDDCLEADSWELLDLVDKVASGKDANNCGLDSAVQLDESSFEICKSSGILKTSSTTYKLSSTSKALQQQHVRQKPKVSFETPDLVNDKQNKKIENEKQENELEASSVGKIKRRSRRHKKPFYSIEEHTSTNRKKNNLSCKQEFGMNGVGNASATDFSDSDDKPSPQSDENLVKTAPVLNYAAAVMRKPVEDLKDKDIEREDEPKKTNVSLKRNRPVSTSSWSSSEELCPEKIDKSTSMLDESCFFENDDNESILSDDFSDCDYGYEAINDFYSRPKRGNTKRGRSSLSTSSSMLASISIKGGDKARKGVVKVAGSSKEQLPVDVSMVKPLRVTLLKSSKLKNKKKIGLNVIKQNESLRKTTFSGNQVDKSIKTKDVSPHQGSSNDSSDIAEMDESWYVTPPPCFTGSKKSKATCAIGGQPIAKEAARENELIEHPAIPMSSKLVRVAMPNEKSIVSKSKQIKADLIRFEPSKDAWDFDCDDDDVDFDIDEAEWIPASRRANSKSTGKISDAKVMSIELKTPSPKSGSIKRTIVKTLTSVDRKMDQKAWKNKFTIDDWNIDDREDADSDFDSIFDTTAKTKSSPKSKKSQRRQATQRKSNNHVVKKDRPDSVENDLDSDVSIDITPLKTPGLGHKSEGGAELLSIRSSSSFDSPIIGDSDMKNNDSFANKENQLSRKVSQKPPTQVRPIEPERRPGWQLKRQRSKRKPVANPPSPQTAASLTKNQSTNKRQNLEIAAKRAKINSTADSSSSSARSTPTLIDRIGSSIVANINNLTSGLVIGGVLQSPSSSSGTSLADESPRSSQINCRDSIIAETYLSNERRKMSKGFLKRQNDCFRQKASQRHPDRRFKMFATPNGCSINRKVQSNYH